MAAAGGVIHVRREGATVTFRVEGRGTMAQSLPLRRFAEGCLGDGATALRFDLRDCAHLDSTFVGTLLTLQKALAQRGGGPLRLVSPSPACARALQGMGLTEVFPADAADPDPGPWAELPAGESDLPAFKRNVAQAHEELANLPGPAGEQFRQVARCMAQAEQAEKQAPPGGPGRG